MLCLNCGQLNQTAKFCVKCGTNLLLSATSETANDDSRPYVEPYDLSKSNESENEQPLPQRSAAYRPSEARARPNPQLEQAKRMSKQYVSFFVDALKSPVRTGRNTTGDHMFNGLITFILLSLIVPLIVYFQLRAGIGRLGIFGELIPVHFSTVVVRPFFYLVIIQLLVNSVIFFVLKPGNTGANFREVTARFGTLLVPSVAFFLFALLFSLLDSSTLTSFGIVMGLLSWCVAVCFVIYSFKERHETGLDAFHGVIITFIVTIILIALLGDDIASSLFRGMRNSIF
ncbi:zinc ribbon domain-containing protein [Cohnella lupini]|uniref:Zinc ribbon protein n=1 Tax=Cohnella lupini TaxID=1294267 RepID=A0A3D9ISJ2_9BACL|nr:zinc ribbon domain-containing protein [Cohnella lupini]RED64730.1 hypothetical protein DFP95_102151 [Cohnella lupini]